MNIIKTLRTTLRGVLSATSTSFSVRSFTDHKGNELEYEDFAGNFVVVVEQGTKIEMILCDDITQNVDGTATLFVATSGRNLDSQPPYAGGASGLTFSTGASVIVTNDPRTISNYIQTILTEDNTWSGNNEFNEFPKKVGTEIATSSDQFMTYGHALLLLTGSANIDKLIFVGTFGEDVVAGNIVYYKEADHKWWKASASASATCQGVKLGIVQANAVADASGNILTGGLDTKQSSLTEGEKYYLSDTPGAISTSKGTLEVFIGWGGENDTDLIWGHNEDLETVTASEKDALATTFPLSENNKVIDEGSVSNNASYTATTIAFVDSDPDTITDSANGFVTAGFKQGQEITIAGSTSNDGTYRIKSVVAGTITLIASEGLTAESAGDTVTISAVRAGKVAQFDENGELPFSSDTPLTALEDMEIGDPVKFYNDSGTVKIEKLYGEYIDKDSTSHTAGTPQALAEEQYQYLERIDDTHFLAFWTAPSNSYLYARIGVVDETTGDVSYGSTVTIDGTGSGKGSAIVLSETKVVFIGTFGAYVGTVSGTTLSLGSQQTVSGYAPNPGWNGIKISDTEFVVAYRNTSAGHLAYGSLDESDNVSLSSGSTFASDSGNYDVEDVRVSYLGNNKFAVAYIMHYTSDYHSRVIVGELSSGVFTFGSVVNVRSNNGEFIGKPARIDDTHFLLTSGDTDAYIYLCSVSGTSVSIDDSIDSTFGNYLGRSHIEVAHYKRNEGVAILFSSRHMCAFSFDTDTGTITKESGATLDADADLYTEGAVVLSPTIAAIQCLDGNNESREQNGVIIATINDYDEYIGITTDNVSADAIVPVCTIKGAVIKNQSVVEGATYYIQNDGTMGIDETDNIIGTAISLTEILRTT